MCLFHKLYSWKSTVHVFWNIYPETSTARPEELETSGSDDYCCIPLCKSSTLDKNKNKTGIGLFSFPSDGKLKKQWIDIVSRYRRRGGNDSFTVTKNTKICEFHFRIDCIKVGYGVGIYFLYIGFLQWKG